MANVCVGLFAPCSNPTDPDLTLQDPEGKGPPIHRCRECAEAVDAILKEIFKSAKKTALFKELLDAAKIVNTKDRGDA